MATIEDCGDLVRSAENGQMLAEKTPALAFVKLWLEEPSMQTEDSKAQMKEIVCGLLAPRFYPQGFDFVEENRSAIFVALKDTLDDRRVSSIVSHAEHAYDFVVDSAVRAKATRDLLAAIRSVDPRLLSETERLLAVEPIVHDKGPHTARLVSLTPAGKLVLAQQQANSRTPQ